MTDAYRGGIAISELAVRFGIRRTTVAQHLHRSGISPRTRDLDNQQVDRAVHWYRQGRSLTKIGVDLDVDAYTIRTALRNHGICMRDA